MQDQQFHPNYIVSVLGAQVHIASLFSFADKTNTAYHHHSHFELHYEMTGRTVYELNSLETVELCPSQWLLLNRGVYHEETNPEPSSGFCVMFEIQPLAKSSPLLVLNYLPWFKRDDPETGRLLEQILREIRDRQIGYEDVCKGFLEALLVHIVRQYPDMNTRFDEKKIVYMNDRTIVDGYFNQVLTGNTTGLSPSDLALRLHVTTRQLNRILKKYYGCTFTQLLNAERVKYAENLLVQTNLPLSRISERCGVSVTYLIRIFKTNRGLTPTQYRKSYKKDVE